jgi:hypothetical protein
MSPEKMSDEEIVATLKAAPHQDHHEVGWVWKTRIKWARCIEAARDAQWQARLEAAVRDERASHERYGMLRDWLVRHGLLHALFCQPEAGMPAGDFWILRKPYMVSGDGCEGYGKTEDEAIDNALDAIRARTKD